MKVIKIENLLDLGWGILIKTGSTLLHSLEQIAFSKRKYNGLIILLFLQFSIDTKIIPIQDHVSYAIIFIFVVWPYSLEQIAFSKIGL